MHIYDLTSSEIQTLMRVGYSVGVHNELDLLRVAEANNIKSGSQLINFIYAAATFGWQQIA